MCMFDYGPLPDTGHTGRHVTLLWSVRACWEGVSAVAMPSVAPAEPSRLGPGTFVLMTKKDIFSHWKCYVENCWGTLVPPENDASIQEVKLRDSAPMESDGKLWHLDPAMPEAITDSLVKGTERSAPTPT